MLGRMSEPRAHVEPEHLLRVLELTRDLAGPASLEEILTRVVDVGCVALQAARGALFLHDAARGELTSRVATSAETIRFSTATGLAGECARTRRVVNVPDAYADPRFNPDIDRDTGFRTHSLLAVPLVGLENELVGVLELLNCARGAFDEADVRLAGVLSSQAAVAIQRARLLEERLVKERLERDMALAREIQLGALPRSLPTVAGYSLAGRARPASETGGDVYDLARVGGDASGSVFVMLADATGHGVGPALSSMQALGMLRVGLRLGAPLDRLVRDVNAQLAEDLSRGRFVTAFIGLLDADTHRVEYHAAGQAPLLLWRDTLGQGETLGATTVPLGVLPELPDDPVAALQLAAGDVLCLLTDGFFEATDAAGQPLGVAPLLTCLAATAGRPLEEVLEALFALVDERLDGRPQADDLTAVVVRREPAG